MGARGALCDRRSNAVAVTKTSLGETNAAAVKGNDDNERASVNSDGRLIHTMSLRRTSTKRKTTKKNSQMHAVCNGGGPHPVHHPCHIVSSCGQPPAMTAARGLALAHPQNLATECALAATQIHTAGASRQRPQVERQSAFGVHAETKSATRSATRSGSADARPSRDGPGETQSAFGGHEEKQSATRSDSATTQFGVEVKEKQNVNANRGHDALSRAGSDDAPGTVNESEMNAVAPDAPAVAAMRSANRSGHASRSGRASRSGHASTNGHANRCANARRRAAVGGASGTENATGSDR